MTISNKEWFIHLTEKFSGNLEAVFKVIIQPQQIKRYLKTCEDLASIGKIFPDHQEELFNIILKLEVFRQFIKEYKDLEILKQSFPEAFVNHQEELLCLIFRPDEFGRLAKNHDDVAILDRIFPDHHRRLFEFILTPKRFNRLAKAKGAIISLATTFLEYESEFYQFMLVPGRFEKYVQGTTILSITIAFPSYKEALYYYITEPIRYNDRLIYNRKFETFVDEGAESFRAFALTFKNHEQELFKRTLNPVNIKKLVSKTSDLAYLADAFPTYRTQLLKYIIEQRLNILCHSTTTPLEEKLIEQLFKFIVQPEQFNRLIIYGIHVKYLVDAFPNYCKELFQLILTPEQFQRLTKEESELLSLFQSFPVYREELWQRLIESGQLELLIKNILCTNNSKKLTSDEKCWYLYRVLPDVYREKLSELITQLEQSNEVAENTLEPMYNATPQDIQKEIFAQRKGVYSYFFDHEAESPTELSSVVKVEGMQHGGEQTSQCLN